MAKRPRITGMPSGRPKIKIDKETLIKAYNELQNWNEVAKYLNISISTVFRCKNEFGINNYIKKVI